MSFGNHGEPRMVFELGSEGSEEGRGLGEISQELVSGHSPDVGSRLRLPGLGKTERRPVKEERRWHEITGWSLICPKITF